jgi:hypothetical protein
VSTPTWNVAGHLGRSALSAAVAGARPAATGTCVRAWSNISGADAGGAPRAAAGTGVSAPVVPRAN